jgi:hypothetical protein
MLVVFFMTYIWAMNVFDITIQTRKNIADIVNHLTLDQMNLIPAGLNNNILWNLGHVLVTQQALTYRLSKQTAKLSSEIIDQFKKGTQPTTYTEDIFKSIMESFFDVVDQTKADYEAGLFQEFHSYTTSYGITLENIDDALEFNNAHEALHLGYIMAIRRMITN